MNYDLIIVGAGPAGMTAALYALRAEKSVLLLDGAGYGGCFGHGLGQGVGLYIHEAPRLSPSGAGTALQVGHVVTVEPGIYLAGRFGVRIEDMAVITDEGCDNLTHCPKELIIL